MCNTQKKDSRLCFIFVGLLCTHKHFSHVDFITLCTIMIFRASTFVAIPPFNPTPSLPPRDSTHPRRRNRWMPSNLVSHLLRLSRLIIANKNMIWWKHVWRTIREVGWSVKLWKRDWICVLWNTRLENLSRVTRDRETVCVWEREREREWERDWNGIEGRRCERRERILILELWLFGKWCARWCNFWFHLE
jgi:hypothetical protein